MQKTATHRLVDEGADARGHVRCDHTRSQPDMTGSEESGDVMASTPVRNRWPPAARARPVAGGIWCG
jgi:hypothetical protein